ncbi:MAG: TMEM43 family protein [Chromatiales bacterium]|nr:TMEM43 family protein [Chromatiales bacterium]
MSRRSNNKLASILLGPALAIGGVLALWENEGRFNYYEAAKQAIVISNYSDHQGEAIAFTSQLDTTIPIKGEYVEQFNSYHIIERDADIYSWSESEDSDGNTTWRKGWYSYLESNSRNRGLRKELTSTTLYPEKYLLGGMEIATARIHFVDAFNAVSESTLTLSEKAHKTGIVKQNGYLYLAKGREDNLGDERISYTGIPNSERASYFGVIENEVGIGRQFEENTGIISTIIANDGILHHLVNGEREESLIKIEEDFKTTMWVTRIGGTLAVIVGFAIFLGSFLSLLFRIPLIGGMIKNSVFIVSVVLGVSVSLIVIFLSMAMHNLFSITLPVIVVVIGVVYVMRRSKTTGENAKRELSSRLAKTIRKESSGTIDADIKSGVASDSKRAGHRESDEEEFILEDNTQAQDIIERTFLHMIAMGVADGGLKKQENKMLIDWGGSNGLSKSSMKQLFEQVKSGSNNAKDASREDLELMACMALVDGEISRGEWVLLTKLAKKVNVTMSELRGIIGDIESGKLSAT